MAGLKEFFKRVSVANRLKGATTFVEDRELHRLPVVYGTNEYFLTRDAMWIGFHVPHKDAGFLSFRRRQDYFESAENWFASFPSEEENAGHILVVNHVQTAADWESSLIEKQRRLADEEERELPYGFVPYIRLARQAIDAQEFFRRDVYLFVRTNDRSDFKGGVKGVLEMMGRQLTSGFGIDDSQPLEEEKQLNDERARQVTAKMAKTWVQPAPLRRSRVEWIIRYIDSLGQPTPDTAPLDEQYWGIGRWQTSMASWTREVDLGKDASNKRIRAVEFLTTTGEGKSYACFLPMAIIPNAISPFSNWLFNASTLQFPVDVSMRFEVVDPVRAEKELDRPIDAAKAQAMEEREADRDLDETTLAQRSQLEAVKRSTIMNREPLVFWQTTLVVYDSDVDVLKKKVAELRAHFDTMQIQLMVPPMDQRSLFYQMFPGSELIVKDWIQRTNTKYVASAMPWLDTSVGASQENPALYQGFTIITQGNQAKPGSPVFFDLVSVADEEGRAPTEFVCGDPGSGKTVSRGLKPVHENALKGITQFVWDPKGDFLPIQKFADKLLLDPDKIRVIELGGGSDTSISLDAFAIAEYDPALEIDDRAATAQDVLHGLTRALRNTSSNNVIHEVIDDAVDVILTAAEREGRQPKMAELFPLLARWQDRNFGSLGISSDKHNAYADAARILQRHLNTIQRNSLGKILFTDPERGSLRVEPGTTTIFNAINLKEVDPEIRSDEGVDTSISRVIQEMMTSYIRSLLYRLPDTVTKAVFFDEWHVIRRSPAAERLLDWLKRMGRSKRTSVTYLSQSALDSGGGTLNSIWCGKCETEENARASCRLLQIEVNDYNVSVLTNLSAGEFVYRDPEGHVARVSVDFWDRDVLNMFNTQAAAKAKAEAEKRRRAAETVKVD